MMDTPDTEEFAALRLLLDLGVHAVVALGVTEADVEVAIAADPRVRAALAPAVTAVGLDPRRLAAMHGRQHRVRSTPE